MKRITKSIKWIALLLVLGMMILACDTLEPLERNAGVSIWKSQESFLADYNTLVGPKGILPINFGLGITHPDIIRKSQEDFYEFFVFDAYKALMILSVTPLYYIKIESQDFYYHLENEYNQFVSNPDIVPEDKHLNTTTHLKFIGDFQVEVYFTPKEIKYTTLGKNKYRIQDSNSVTFVDPWRLLGAANFAVLYFPFFKEEKLFSDLYNQSQEGRTRFIFTGESTLTPPNYALIDNPELNFPFMIGQNLEITEDLLGHDDIEFIDPLERTKDFAVFFSMPLGNATEEGEDNLNLYHGFAIQVRGRLNNIIRFLELEGINFQDQGELATNFDLVDQNPDLYINWFTQRDVIILLSEDGETYYQVAEVNNQTSHTLSGLSRGEKYWIRLISASTGNELGTNSIILPKEPATGEIRFTEILWAGTYDGTAHSSDEFLEIKNISESYIDLSRLRITFQQTEPSIGEEKVFAEEYDLADYILAPDEYFLIINYTDHLFSEENLNPLEEDYIALSPVALNNPDSASDEYTVYLYLDAIEIDSASYTKTLGLSETTEKRSAVLFNDYTWQTSQNDVNIEDFAGFTFASPGYAAEGEL